MNLVIFDIDGTLTETTALDTDCFVRALAAVHGFKAINPDWSAYKYSTDGGIFQEIYEAHTGQLPSDHDLNRFRQYFVKQLELESAKTAFRPIAGAPETLAWLKQHPDYCVSLATGAWQDSARLKLANAGLVFDEFPAATGDDALEREAIIQLSRLRAAKLRGTFDGAVYVGDGVWDARACRNIGMPFVGIGKAEKASRLKVEGAVEVFPDFCQPAAFMACLQAIFGKSATGK